MKLPGSKFDYPSRPKRKRRVLILYGSALVVWYAMLWGLPKSKSVALGWQTRSYGLFKYLKFYRYPTRQPLPNAPPQKAMEVSWLAITLNVVLTVAPTLILIQVGWYATRPRRSNRFCDECGYDLKPSASQTCPECGRQRNP